MERTYLRGGSAAARRLRRLPMYGKAWAGSLTEIQLQFSTEEITMSRQEKLRAKFLQEPTRTDIQWSELVKLLEGFGYSLSLRGGSRRMFYNQETGHKISLHEPHPQSVVKSVYIRDVVAVLREQGLME